MGIFDGILICSDWDGTLFCDKTVPQKTRDAVNYFMSEGGHFAITSGRGPDYLYEQRHLVMPNTYCICYGGSLICNIESGDVIREGYLGDNALALVDRMLLSDIDIVKLNAHTTEGIISYTPTEYFEFARNKILSYSNYKITFNCSSDAEGGKLKSLCDSFGSAEYTFARSFASYLEIMKTEYTKGISARLLKERLGDRVLVGMGDYENDIPLFEECDVSFAVANAEESLKRIATHVTGATVRQSAANEVVKTLEEMIRNGML